MFDTKVGDLLPEKLEQLLVDAYEWLVLNHGENSVLTNKVNYLKKYSPLRRATFKHHLKVIWDYNSYNLGWKPGVQYAICDFSNNTIYLHCNKNFTLRFLLETFFHEYCHTQQSSFQYSYYRLVDKKSYYDHPLEHQANEFASHNVELFIKDYFSKK